MITDEMVEAAAGAYWFEVYGKYRKKPCKWPDDVYGNSRLLFRDGCRAALEATFAAMPNPDPVGCVSEMPGSNGGFTMAVFRATDVPLGSNLYLAPPSPAVIVKALEWNAEANGDFIAQSAVGWYHIGFPARSWNLTTPSGDVPSFEILEYAKAAAQADYETRILSAINTSPEPAAPAVPEGWKLVPVYPTGEMLKAALDACPVAPAGMDSKEADYFCAAEEYRAMLAAAPEDPHV